MSEFNTNVTNQSGEGQEIKSVEMKTFYDSELIKNAEPLLVHDKFGQKRSIPKGNGKTIEFRKLNPFPKASAPLTEGVTPDGKKLDWSKQTATVNQYGDYVTVSDVLDLTAIDNNILEATVILGDQAGRTLDTVTREVINAGTNVQYAAGEISSRREITPEHIMTVAAVKKAVNTLKKGLAKKIDGSYFAIIHPNVAYDLMNDKEWQSLKEYNPQDWYEGEIGKIFGCRFIESSEAKVFLNALLADKYNCLTINSADINDKNIIYVDEDFSEADGVLFVGKRVTINGNSYTIVSAVASEQKIVLDREIDGIQMGMDVIPDELSEDGTTVYSTLFIGADAYGVTEVEGGGLKTIIKQLGSAGSGDPLDQRATVGWKALKTAAILSQPFMVRVETASSLED
ncbi:MAG: N4-gp56 family major capsid protein [Oscillospiraceae bacterium]|nr:N4-gp56 family major capsid protein [Oscillospiraceae bacterium]